MNFGEAIVAIKQGNKVTRKGWNGNNMWLILISADQWGLNSDIPFDWGSTENHLEPWIGLKTANNGFVPWLASQTDILAEDWSVI